MAGRVWAGGGVRAIDPRAQRRLACVRACMRVHKRGDATSGAHTAYWVFCLGLWRAVHATCVTIGIDASSGAQLGFAPRFIADEMSGRALGQPKAKWQASLLEPARTSRQLWKGGVALDAKYGAVDASSIAPLSPRYCVTPGGGTEPYCYIVCVPDKEKCGMEMQIPECVSLQMGRPKAAGCIR